MPLTLYLLPHILGIARLNPTSNVPSYVWDQPFLAIIRTPNELTIVSRVEALMECEPIEPGWRALEVEGPLDFSLTGILASLASPLAAAQISIFALSSFDTDYVLVRETDLEAAIQVLTQNKHRILRGDR